MTNKQPTPKQEIMARRLHEWYLESVKLNYGAGNPEAQVPYKELTESQKFIDRYIAKKVLQELAKAKQELWKEILEFNKKDIPVEYEFTISERNGWNRAIGDLFCLLKEKKLIRYIKTYKSKKIQP